MSFDDFVFDHPLIWFGLLFAAAAVIFFGIVVAADPKTWGYVCVASHSEQRVSMPIGVVVGGGQGGGGIAIPMGGGRITTVEVCDDWEKP